MNVKTCWIVHIYSKINYSYSFSYSDWTQETQHMDLNIDPEHFKYTEILDRGGLVYPSDLFFMVLQISCKFFSICVDKKFEAQFLKLANQKQTLIAVIKHCLTSRDDYMETFYVCELCETPCMTHLLKAISCFSNICLIIIRKVAERNS